MTLGLEKWFMADLMAMKLIQISSKYAIGGTSPISVSTFKCADGKIISINTFNKFKLYRTIEDCINDEYPIDTYYCDFTSNVIEEGFSFEIVKPLGYQQLGLKKYFWNGYNVETRHIPHSYFDMIFSEDECVIITNDSFTLKYGKYKFYNSEEDCRKEHVVQVVTF